MTIYLAILAVGILAIVVILMNENKSSKPSPVDLLNSLTVDENEEKKSAPKAANNASSFLNRLNLNENMPKKEEATSKTYDQNKQEDLDQLTATFEEKLKKTTAQTEKPILPIDTVDKSTKDENTSLY